MEFDVYVGAENGKAVYRKVEAGAQMNCDFGDDVQVSFTKNGKPVPCEIISEEEAKKLGAKVPSPSQLRLASSIANIANCSKVHNPQSTVMNFNF
jgi:hypothetical protein